jgi:hypothetical protein
MNTCYVAQISLLDEEDAENLFNNFYDLLQHIREREFAENCLLDVLTWLIWRFEETQKPKEWVMTFGPES